MRNIAATFLFFALIVSLSSFSFAQDACPQHFAGGQAPVLVNPKMANKYRVLCNSGFANGHSGLTRGPLWGAELLNKNDLDEGRGVARHDNFRPDPRLPSDERSELRDFQRSGFDRGHCINNRDMIPENRDGTFLLSNMMAQDHSNNTGLWSAIESATRYEAKRRGQIYVITGPLFRGQLRALKGRVIIPSGIFKCLYDQQRQQAGCYVTPNAPGDQYNVASVAEVEQAAGINLFPAMPVQVKAQAIKLSAPKMRH